MDVWGNDPTIALLTLLHETNVYRTAVVDLSVKFADYFWNRSEHLILGLSLPIIA